MRRPGRIAALAALAFSAASPGVGAAEGEEDARESSSVAAANGIVVHSVDSKLLAARLRDVDGRVAEGRTETAARELADLASADLDALLEEGEGTYLSAQESVHVRVAALPPDARDVYRRLLDSRARVALDAALEHGDPTPLAREAFRLALTTEGPRMLVTLADLRIARGDLGGAARALEDLLRLHPGDSAEVEGVPRAAVVSRLATLAAAQGDGPSVRALLAACGPALRDAAEPQGSGRSLSTHLTRLAALADSRYAAGAGASAADPGPSGAVRLVAETQLPKGVRERGAPSDDRDPRRIAERPVAVGTAERPVLLARRFNPSRTAARVEALTPAPPAEGDATPPGPGPVPPVALVPLWTWPSSAVEEERPPGDLPFAPVRIGDDLVAFTWPAPASEIVPRDGRFAAAGDERHQLVLLSLRGEGRLVDERGRFEARRSDADPAFETLSFCGRPAWVEGDDVSSGAAAALGGGSWGTSSGTSGGSPGGALYVTLFRPSESGAATELHVARFDLVPAGKDPRLRLRWRRHVLDGSVLPAARHPAKMDDELALPPALPSSPLVRNGRVYVVSNTGAVACLDSLTGRPEWVETYERAGPTMRTTVRETGRSPADCWGDVPLHADGAFVFATPRDSESVIQYRPAPTRERSLRVESFAFAAPSGTARRPSRPLPDVVPFDVPAVRDGVVYLSGRVVRRALGSLRIEGSPLAAFPLGTRRPLLAQVQETSAVGAARLAGGALFFPTAKAIYRVPLSDVEATPTVLWKATLPPDTHRGPDRIGNLIPDGKRLWSVTPTRICLFE